jgi:hypothetical protein
MDPFLEGEEWEDFHTRFNTAISDFLSPRIEPRYFVRIERRVYVEHIVGDDTGLRRADVAVLADENEGPHFGKPSPAAATVVAPVECLLPMPEEKRETYVVVRERETREVVTIVETLSPGNKRPSSVGRNEYLAKREELLQSQAHFVELDLLRGGERLPMSSPMPRGDYYAIVSRCERRPRAELYPWTIRDPLPAIPVPLKKGDPDAQLELQAVFATVYDRARYHLSLDYSQPLSPSLNEADAAWLKELLATHKG